MSDVLKNVVNLFPLSVYISEVAEHAALKDALVPEIKALPPYQPDSRYAWTGDVQGHGFIHLEESFRPWLDAMVPHIRRYLELLQLRTEHLDIYFQRSWPAVAKRHQEIAAHNHENAHIYNPRTATPAKSSCRIFPCGKNSRPGAIAASPEDAKRLQLIRQEVTGTSCLILRDSRAWPIAAR